MTVLILEGKMSSRYYSHDTGRFISEDPIGFAGEDFNLYRYVENNPLKFIDPFGEQAAEFINGVGAPALAQCIAYLINKCACATGAQTKECQDKFNPPKPNKPTVKPFPLTLPPIVVPPPPRNSCGE